MAEKTGDEESQAPTHGMGADYGVCHQNADADASQNMDSAVEENVLGQVLFQFFHLFTPFPY